jgi:hypothetical protein
MPKHLLQKFFPVKSLKMKFGKKGSEKKLYCLENDAQNSVFSQ